MTKAIPVRIKLESEWDDERAEQQFSGQLYRKGTAIYVQYMEEDEQAGLTRTLVKLAEREIKIIRRGQVEAEQNFSVHEERRGHYRTELGTLPVVTRTLHMNVRMVNGSGEAEWSYQLWIAEESAGTFNLKLTIQEEQV